MAQEVSAIVARSYEAEEKLAQVFDARRERIAEIARQRTDPNVARVDRPKPAAEVDTTKAVVAAAQSSAARPTLSSDVRSMLLEPPQSPQQRDTRSSTLLIGQLLDALRQYERDGPL